jgi:hypothetical protein
MKEKKTENSTQGQGSAQLEDFEALLALSAKELSFPAGKNSKKMLEFIGTYRI